VAARTASITDARSPPRSNSASPAIVVPPGLVTISEERRVHHRLGNHACGAGHRLDGKLGGKIAGQSRLHAAVGQRLDEQIDISRTASAQARDRIEKVLADVERAADRSEDFLDRGDILVRHAPAGGVSGGAFLHERGSVRHDADHAAFRPGGQLQRFNGDAGDDGNEQLPREVGSGVGQGGEGVLGLHTEQNDIGSRGHFPVAAQHADPALGSEHFSRLGNLVVHRDVGGFADLGRQNALDEGGAHFPATDETDFHGN
jgi:hypothetical protein